MKFKINYGSQRPLNTTHEAEPRANRIELENGYVDNPLIFIGIGD